MNYKHLKQLCFHMFSNKCTEELNTTVRASHDLNMAMYQNHKANRYMHPFCGWVHTKATAHWQDFSIHLNFQVSAYHVSQCYKCYQR